MRGRGGECIRDASTSSVAVRLLWESSVIRSSENLLCEHGAKEEERLTIAQRRDWSLKKSKNVSGDVVGFLTGLLGARDLSSFDFHLFFFSQKIFVVQYLVVVLLLEVLLVNKW